MENLNKIPVKGLFKDIANFLNANFTLIKEALEEMLNKQGNDKGIYSSAEALQAAYPSPQVGNRALVGAASPFTVYQCETDGLWKNTGITESHDITLADYATKQDVTEAVAGITVETVNSLEETTPGKALDATQGKALADRIETLSETNKSIGKRVVEFSTDAATTRLQIVPADRKEGFMLSYKNSDGEWVNEQYSGTSLLDDDWKNSSFWFPIGGNKKDIDKLTKHQELTDKVLSAAVTDNRDYISRYSKQKNTIRLYKEDLLALGATRLNGRILADGTVSLGNMFYGLYFFKNDNYNLIEASSKNGSGEQSSIITFYSSEELDDTAVIKKIPFSANAFTRFQSKVPEGCRLIAITQAASQGIDVQDNGNYFFVEKRKEDFDFNRQVVNNLMSDKQNFVLSANQGRILSENAVRYDAAKAKAMQQGMPFMRMVLLDAGRKYFSVDNIERILDMMQTVSLNYFVMYIADNNAFRFLLDDHMVVTDTGSTYDLSKAVGEEGTYLTETDVNEIISYAKARGISVIGMLDMPGHMGKLLQTFFKPARISIDYNDVRQVEFGIAVTKKYADYFASKGSVYYSFGGDESGGNKTEFPKFVNRLCREVINRNMIPLIWNDELCRYNGFRNDPYINDGAICMFWGANNQTANQVENAGFSMINSSMDIYYAIGQSSMKPTVGKMRTFKVPRFQGNSIISRNIVGAQFAIWCDGAGGVEDLDNDGTDIVNKTLPLIEAFGQTIANQTQTARATDYRPVKPCAGDQYFDTTLNKPIWYNGISWVDSTGTTV